MKSYKMVPVSLAVYLSTQVAWAQDELPEGLLEEKKATSGTTDVADEGFQTAKVDDGEPKDATELTLTAGALYAEGNSKSLSLTASSAFRMRRQRHQLSAAAAVNYGEGASAGAAERKVNVENYQGRVRYDYFITRYLAAFLAVSGRRDRFQGLDLRLNVDPGFAYYFIDVEKHQLWAELGYDLQHDVRRDEARVVLDDNGDPVDPPELLDKSETRHHARLFVGYDNKLNEAVTFNAGVEYLQGLAPFEDDDTGNANWQLNSQLGLTSKLGEGFSLATSLGLKYDNNPLPDVESADVITAVSLVYSVL